MNDNGNIRLLTPENDIRVRAFLSSLEELSEKVEKIRENNKPSLDGERYYTDKELAVKLRSAAGAFRITETTAYCLYSDRRQDPVQGFRH